MRITKEKKGDHAPRDLEQASARLLAEATSFAEKYQGKTNRLTASQLGAAIENFEKISEQAAGLSEAGESLRPVLRSLLFFAPEIAALAQDKKLPDPASDEIFNKYAPWIARMQRLYAQSAIKPELRQYLFDKTLVAEDAWRRLWTEMIPGGDADVFALVAGTLCSLRAARDEWGAAPLSDITPDAKNLFMAAVQKSGPTLLQRYCAWKKGKPSLALNESKGFIAEAQKIGEENHRKLASAQGYLKSDTPLPLLEASGFFSATLVFHDLLEQEKDLEVCRDLIADRIEAMLEAVVRQPMLLVFERELQEVHQQNGTLLAREISALWLQSQKSLYGDTVDLDQPTAANAWTSIPLFAERGLLETAIGACIGIALSRGYGAATNPGEFTQKYTELMKAGGTEDMPGLLAKMGVDMNAPDFYEEVLAFIGTRLDVLIALDEKILLMQKRQHDFKDTADDIVIPPPQSPPHGGGPDPGGPRL